MAFPWRVGGARDPECPEEKEKKDELRNDCKEMEPLRKAAKEIDEVDQRPPRAQSKDDTARARRSDRAVARKRKRNEERDERRKAQPAAGKRATPVSFRYAESGGRRSTARAVAIVARQEDVTRAASSCYFCLTRGYFQQPDEARQGKRPVMDHAAIRWADVELVKKK